MHADYDVRPGGRNLVEHVGRDGARVGSAGVPQRPTSHRVERPARSPSIDAGTSTPDDHHDHRFGQSRPTVARADHRRCPGDRPAARSSLPGTTATDGEVSLKINNVRLADGRSNEWSHEPASPSRCPAVGTDAEAAVERRSKSCRRRRSSRFRSSSVRRSRAWRDDRSSRAPGNGRAASVNRGTVATVEPGSGIAVAAKRRQGRHPGVAAQQPGRRSLTSSRASAHLEHRHPGRSQQPGCLLKSALRRHRVPACGVQAYPRSNGYSGRRRWW